MANIYKRGKTYWGRARKNGKEYRQSLGTSARALATKRLAEWLEEMDRLEWGGKPKYNYREMMEHFILSHCPLLKPNSAKRYRTSAKMMHKHFIDLDLEEINTAALTDYMVYRQRQAVTDSTIIRDLACLSSAFQEFAFFKEDDTLPNPVAPFLKRHKKKGTLRESEPRTRYLSHKDEEKLLKQIPAYMYSSFVSAIDTGLRLEELLSLTWPQVSLSRNEILITADKAKGRKARTIPILDRTGTILGTLPRHLRTQGETDWVFNKANGTRYGKFTRGLTAAVKRAKLEHVIWHDLRRTCGCRLLQDYEMPLERVSKWLGHKTIAQTQRAYAFLEVEHLHKSIEAGTKTGTRHADYKKAID